MKYTPSQKGFTLIEVLIAITILLVIAAMAVPSWQSFSDVINVGNTAKTIDAKIKLAKNYSLSSLNDTTYGVRFETGKVTLFNTTPYTVIEEYVLPAGMEIYDVSLNGGGTDAVFGRLTGTTDNSGSVKIRIAARPSMLKQIYINSQGQVGADSFPVSSSAPNKEGFHGGDEINARHIHFNLAAWSIQNSSTITKLIFRKNDGTPGTLIEQFDTAPYFSAGIFDWEGSISIDSTVQKLRIHTLNVSGTTLCIMRDRMENTKDVKISFLDSSGIEKQVVIYVENADGTVTVTPNTPTWVESISSQ